MDIPINDDKINGGSHNMVNGEDIVLVRKRNPQQLFTRTYNEDEGLDKLRMGGSMVNK